jgi:hypothetical protein
MSREESALVERHFQPCEPDAEDPIEKEFLPILAKLRQERALSRWVGSKGDIVVMLSHVTVHAGRAEPALFLYNRRRPGGKPVVLPLSQLWMAVSATEAMAAMARDMDEKLFGVSTRSGAIRIQDVFFDFAEDLKNAPPADQIAIGDWMQAIAEDGMKSRINGKTVCD